MSRDEAAGEGAMSYERLAEKLDEAALGAPRSGELLRILAELFTPEEAGLAAALSFRPTPVEKAAAAAGLEAGEAGRLLEGMADKGLVFARRGQKGDSYALLPVLPGIFELQFMKGEGGPRQTRLARLYERYYAESLAPRLAEGRSAGYARVLPVERTIPSPMEIYPYEEAGRYLRQGDGFALTRCHCRHQKELIGEGCGAPQDVCMLFGPFAAFAVERGFARAATRAEMLDALDRSEAHGLVHVSDNVADRINFLCNCCRCCCGFLRAAGEVGRANVVAASRFGAVLDAASCVSCGACIERCPAGAVRQADDAVALDPKRCLGCGVCLGACPAGALTLGPREGFAPPAATRAELDARLREGRRR